MQERLSIKRSEKVPEAIDQKGERRKLLNEAFKNGNSAFEHIESLSQLEFPILVDFNGVLVTNSAGLELNPEAPALLERLRELGDVVIVTTSEPWQGVYNRLQELGLSDDIILMTKRNYYCDYDHLDRLELDLNIKPDVFWRAFLESPALTTPEREIIVRSNANPVTLSSSSAAKRVGVIFNKPFRLPIIDDTRYPGEDNPGIDLLQVNEFGSDKPTTKNPLTFTDVIDRVSQMKSAMTTMHNNE